MKIELEFEREDDGRWIAEAPAWPGVMAYGASREDAAKRVKPWLCGLSRTKLKMENFCRLLILFPLQELSMSQWPSVKARRLLAALIRIGWVEKRQSGSHRTLTRPGWPDKEVTLTIKIPKELHRKVKMLAAREAKSIKDCILESLDEKFPGWRETKEK